MNKDILLYFALLLWFVVPITAQPTIFVASDTVEPNATVNIDVSVVDFEDILSMQFSINWNPDVVQFDSVSNVTALPDYDNSQSYFGTNSTHLGKLTTMWIDNLFLGVSLDDSTTIFTLNFTAIGPSDSVSTVAITGDPTAIEISDANGNILVPIIENGMVAIATVVGLNPSIESQSNEFFTLYQNEPNPFDNQSVIRFDLRQSNEVSFSFYDTNGKLIYSHKGNFQQGINSIKIDTEKLPGAGTYFYTMKTNNYFLTNKMVLLR